MPNYKILFEDEQGKRESMVLQHCTLAGAVAVAVARSEHRSEFKGMQPIGAALTTVKMA